MAPPIVSTRRFFGPFALLLLCLAGAPALGAAPLLYHDVAAGTDIRVRQMAALAIESGAIRAEAPFEYARLDLNGDGVDEIILRQRQERCAERAACPHVIMALRRGKPFILLNLSARKIGMAQEKSYGVAGLLVYNRPNNHFLYEIHRWDPHIAGFALTGTGQER